MISITDIIVNFGDIIELDFPLWDLENSMKHLINHQGWEQYNPRKSNNRKGLSVTSLDGKYLGIPDLDSLREFNLLNGTHYCENNFKTRTDIVNFIPELNILLDTFPDHGRCHFLKLDAGGFFPAHRDNLSIGVSGIIIVLIPMLSAFGLIHITLIRSFGIDYV